MLITIRDRKLLWACAGGTFMLCKSQLMAESKGNNRAVAFGEEAHVVSEEPKGPRFHPMPTKEVDAYNNLILLCLSDHKIVDEQVTYYTEECLQALKREHEQWVKEKISPAVEPQSQPAIQRRINH